MGPGKANTWVFDRHGRKQTLEEAHYFGVFTKQAFTALKWSAHCRPKGSGEGQKVLVFLSMVLQISFLDDVYVNIGEPSNPHPHEAGESSCCKNGTIS